MSEALFCSGFVMFNAENGILVFDCNLRLREFCIGLTTSGRVSIKMCDVGANLGDNLMPGELFTGYEPSLQDSRCVYEAISALSWQGKKAGNVFSFHDHEFKISHGYTGSPFLRAIDMWERFNSAGSFPVLWSQARFILSGPTKYIKMFMQRQNIPAMWRRKINQWVKMQGDAERCLICVSDGWQSHANVQKCAAGFLNAR